MDAVAERNRVVAIALARVSSLPLPAVVGKAKTSEGMDSYDDFRYVDCPYDDYQDK
jgi:hypothetical protein